MFTLQPNYLQTIFTYFSGLKLSSLLEEGEALYIILGPIFEGVG